MDLEARLDLVIEIMNFGLHKEKPVSFSGPIAILALQSSFRRYLPYFDIYLVLYNCN